MLFAGSHVCAPSDHFPAASQSYWQGSAAWQDQAMIRGLNTSKSPSQCPLPGRLQTDPPGPSPAMPEPLLRGHL